MERYSVILAGGGGTRFWPLSRQHTPKQLLNLSGNDVMINETISRCDGVVKQQNTLIVTNTSQQGYLKEVILPGVQEENVLIEPFGRNTAPCIAYAAMVIRKKYGDGIMTVLPSDHFVSKTEVFQKVLEKGCKLAEESDKLVTIGIRPSFPSTGYGYIRYCPEADHAGDHAHMVEAFIEKPNYELARTYIENGNYLWNSGIFVWKASVILENFKRYLPRLYNSMMSISDKIGTESEAAAIKEVYSAIQPISIDYGILERSDEVVVISGDFGWNDVGSWDSLGSIFPTDSDGNIIKAKHVGIGTRNSIIYSNERLIATIGVEDLIIADTPDALLICPKSRSQEVKGIVEQLNNKGMADYI